MVSAILIHPATRAASKNAGSVGPAIPLASRAQVSDVLVSVSIDSMLNDTSAARRNIPSSVGASNLASVKM